MKQYGLASEKVNAPETVFGMGDGCQQRNALALGIGVLVLCKNATNQRPFCGSPAWVVFLYSTMAAMMSLGPWDPVDYDEGAYRATNEVG